MSFYLLDNRWKKFTTPLPVDRFIEFNKLKASGSTPFLSRLPPLEVAGEPNGDSFFDSVCGDNYSWWQLRGSVWVLSMASPGMVRLLARFQFYWEKRVLTDITVGAISEDICSNSFG